MTFPKFSIGFFLFFFCVVYIGDSILMRDVNGALSGFTKQ